MSSRKNRKKNNFTHQDDDKSEKKITTVPSSDSNESGILLGNINNSFPRITDNTSWVLRPPILNNVISADHWSTITNFQKTFNTFDKVNEITKVYGLTDAMRSATSILGMNPSISATPIPDYSNLASMYGSIGVLNSLKHPAGSPNIPNRSIFVGDKSYDNLINFNYDNSSKITELEKKLKITNTKIKDLEFKNESLETKTAEYDVLLKDKTSVEEELLLLKQRGHINSRISDIHLSNLIQSEAFFNEFEDLKNVDAVVISIDIRKSTELMLKAVSPQHFAKFITKLSNLLSTCVKLNYGVFDKFTGDGILAFFPKFLSGDHALLYALKAAMECHSIFEEHYKRHEFSFQVFNKSIGLGIGIECGNVAIVNNGVELTIVGTPVVYACRLGGAPSNTTLIGQKAMQTINQHFDRNVEVENDELNIKHEGVIGVYKLKKLKHLENFLQAPDWSKYIVIDEEKNTQEKVKENRTKDGDDI